MRRPLLILFLAAGVLAGCGEEPDSDLAGEAAVLARVVAAGEDHVTVQELADWLIKDRRDFELVDIRERSDFDSANIQGARHVPLTALLSKRALETLPIGIRVVVYSNGSAHAAQAALLLRLTGREAYALLGGFNYWQAYLKDPASAGVAEMDPAQRARYQAVSCYFEGEYVAAAGLLPKMAGMLPGQEAGKAPEGTDPLGLGLGLGSAAVRAMGFGGGGHKTEARPPESLGLGLKYGLGSPAVEALMKKADPASGDTRRLLIRAEC